MAAEDETGGSKKINLTIKFGDGNDDVQIKCKPTTPFSKIYAAIASQKGVAVDSFKLVWDGNRLEGVATPKMMEFEEEEQIDYLVQQIGGAHAA